MDFAIKHYQALCCLQSSMEIEDEESSSFFMDQLKECNLPKRSRQDIQKDILQLEENIRIAKQSDASYDSTWETLHLPALQWELSQCKR